MCMYVHVTSECVRACIVVVKSPSLFPQGVEVFEEKLNPLCMQWLIDNGEYMYMYISPSLPLFMLHVPFFIQYLLSVRLPQSTFVT